MIDSESPDVLGLQEIYGTMQQDFINNYGSQYGVLSDDTLGTQPGLMNVILYKESKYNFLNGGSFRLSSQPDNSIPSWQDVYKRVCTWGIFETKTTEPPMKFKALSCHLPAGNSVQTKLAVEAIASNLWSSQDSSLPHFVMGDFNSLSSSTAISYLTSEEGAELTYIYPNGFRSLIDHLDDFKIDYVFRTSGGYLFSEIVKAGQTPYTLNFRPSDHPAIVLKGSFIEKSSLVASLVSSVLKIFLIDEDALDVVSEETEE